MTKRDPVQALADYLTENQRVVRSSMSLQLSGWQADEANAFFRLREQLGVGGYDTADQAKEAIRRVLLDSGIGGPQHV